MLPPSIRRAALLIGALAIVSIAGCAEAPDPRPILGRLNFPIGMALHPSGSHLYVVNSNFESRYSPAQGGSLAVVDLETLRILSSASPYLPSFGGTVALSEDGRRAYVSARRGDAIVALQVSEDGARVGCGASLSSDTRSCALSRVPDRSGAPVVPGDPFGLAVTTIERGERSIDVVAAAHLSSPAVSVLALPDGDRARASLSSAPLLNSTNAVARRPGTLQFYATGRRSASVAVFSPLIGEGGEIEAIFERGGFVLNRATNAVDARGIAFSPSGETIAVVSRAPDALQIWEVLDGDGAPRHALRRVIELAEGPSDVAWHVGAGGRALAIVPCFDAGELYIIDVDAGAIVRRVRTDADPYQVVTESGIEGRCGRPGERCLAYISLFADTPSVGERCDADSLGCGSVALLDLDPASSRYLQVFDKIR